MSGTLTPSMWGKPFKRCPMCRAVWRTREEFLRNPGLECIGHQENAKGGKGRLILFNHCCGTTLMIEEERLAGSSVGYPPDSRVRASKSSGR
jgi:hypothetical protein